MKIQHQSMRTLRFVGLGATVSLLFLFAFVLSPPKPVNTNAIPSDYIPSATSLTLGIGDDPLLLDLEPTSPNGTFKESSTMSIIASTNNYTGYTLTLDAKEDLDNPTNVTKLLNTDPECLPSNPKCYIESITTTTTANDYITPSTTAAINSLRNTWGISPSQYVDGNNTTIPNDANDGTESYLPITSPITIAKTTTSNTPNTNNESNTYTLKLGARIDTTLPTGTYENTFVFTVVGNGAAYTINYIDPSNEGTNIPVEQTGTTSATSINLSSTTPTRTSHTFLGWCSAELVNYACDDTIYQPNDAIYLDYTTNNATSLYAIWNVTFDDSYTIATKQKYNNTNYYSMQDMSDSICSIVTEHEETQLIDERDDKVYYVAKLADKRCWMTQNLDHDIKSNYSYNYTNTDIPVGWNDTLTDTHATSDKSWNWYPDAPESYDPGSLCWNGILDTDWSKDIADLTSSCSQNGNHYHIGNYYNWTAAIAMSSSSSYGDGSGDALVNQSICPAGWTLPLGGKGLVSGSYDYLADRLGLNSGANGNIQNSPVYFVYTGGWIDNGSFGSYGIYWSRVPINNNRAYTLTFAFNGYFAVTYAGRKDGYSVRCLAH